MRYEGDMEKYEENQGNAKGCEFGGSGNLGGISIFQVQDER